MGAAVTSSNPLAGAAFSATATCPAGTMLLGGGALVTTAGTTKPMTFLSASYPSSTTVWTATATTGLAGAGGGPGSPSATLTAYAICTV